MMNDSSTGPHETNVNANLVIDCYEPMNNVFWSIGKIIKLQKFIKLYLKKLKSTVEIYAKVKTKSNINDSQAQVLVIYSNKA
jgi:hypothetical protein